MKIYHVITGLAGIAASVYISARYHAGFWPIIPSFASGTLAGQAIGSAIGRR